MREVDLPAVPVGTTNQKIEQLWDYLFRLATEHNLLVGELEAGKEIKK